MQNYSTKHLFAYSYVTDFRLKILKGYKMGGSTAWRNWSTTNSVGRQKGAKMLDVNGKNDCSECS